MVGSRVKVGLGVGAALSGVGVAFVAVSVFSQMTINQFKDLSEGLQSNAIVIATFLGGCWALFQFFSLRALDRAKLELQKAKRELVERVFS